MSNNNKTPAIRFKGFTDTWEQRKFSELTEIRSASRVHKEEWQSSGVPFYRSSDVMAALNGTENEKAFISEELYEKLSAVSGKLEKGDVLVTGGGSVGKPYIVPNNEPLYTKDADLLWIKNNENLDPYFVYTFFFSPTFTDYLNSVSHVGTIAHYTITQLGETPITLPCVSEQQKIGDYFRNLDSIITLHQRKCDKLIQFKAAKLQKMFPQNGANKPEIRFRGFTDAWEQRELGELMEITSVKRIHQSDWTDSGVRFLRARDIVAVSKNEEVSEPLFISQEKYDEYSALSGKVKIGDLLVTGVGTIGVPMLINNEEPLYFKDGNIIWFKNEDRIDGEFFYHSFNGSFIQNFIKESAGIGTVGTYTIESGKKTPVLLPTQKDEQQKIGTFFSQLDTLITIHQRKCDKYKSIKAGLLKKLFP
jgi:type I restriction enzyme S subunit